MSSERDAIERFVAEEMNRKQLLLRFTAAGAALTLPGLLSGCGGGGGGEEEGGGGAPKKGGRFRMARNEEPLSLDPIVPSDNGSIWVIYQIFDQLTTVNKNSTGVVPSLAASWDSSDDGKTWTFHLRPGAKFSDGTRVTADDVVFSLRRAVNPKTSAYSFLFGPVTGVEAIDAATVRITLKHPFAPLLEHLNVFPASIVPRAMVEKNAEGFARRPVGTGPFKLKEFAKGRFVHLVRNESYWKEGRPLLDEVVIPYVTDDNTRIIKLQAGEIDAAVNVPYAQIKQLEARDDVDIKIEPIFRFDGIWLNNGKKPLDDLKVRQALNYATDKESMLKSVYFGNVELANHMMPKMKYWREDVDPYPYDPEKAKSLIAQSSAAGGVTIPVVVPTGDVIISQLAQIVKESWAKIGVNVDITNLDIGTAYTNFSNFNYTAGANWYITSDVTAPDELAAIQFDYWALGGTHSFFTNYRSREASKLIATAAAATDEGTREQAFGDLQQRVMDDAPMVALFFTPARTGLRKGVHDFQTVKTAWWRLEDVWLES
ncbi:MAG: ABC transporter substrate-binding protein [Actinomycetota bacterium]|nr:ABC transporter substrate-binding protein [Actinomycetota bacterium]